MSKTPTNPRIIWLASYPRSGNTWLRFLLANLLVKDIGASRQVEAMMPTLAVVKGQKLVLSPKQRSLVATQWPYDPDNDLFKLSAGFIYVVRNPRDMMRSLFEFNRTEFAPDGTSEQEAVMAAAWERYVQAFIEAKGHPLRGRDGGAIDWIRHVESWRRAADTVPGLFIRYEDLLADTRREMGRICAFIGAAPSDAVIDTAVAKSTFAAMQTMESREVADKTPGIFYRPTHEAFAAKGIRVLGRGTMDDTTLSAEQNRAFAAVFGETMAALGYAIDADSGRLTVSDTPIGDEAVLPPGPELTAPRVGVAGPQSSAPSDLVES